jgi:hypothetical protein
LTHDDASTAFQRYVAIIVLVVQVLTLGGSWSGPLSDTKDAELYVPGTFPWTGKWDKLSKIQAKEILTHDPEGMYRADNYGWFFAWSGGSGTLSVTACLLIHTSCLCLKSPRKKSYGIRIWFPD